MTRSRIGSLLAGLLIVSVLLCFGRAAFGSEGPPPVLHIKTYTSPSGEWTLVVDPSKLEGHGSGQYRLSRRGQAVWTRTLPYTLWDAAVLDDGTSAGYAYTHGWRGMPEEPGGTWHGEFIVAILGPDGAERLAERTQRQEARQFHTPPNPLALGMFVEPATDRLVIRVRAASSRWNKESWWTYDISDARPRPRATYDGPPEEARAFCYAAYAAPVTGTVLTLISHVRSDHDSGVSGIRLALADASATELWSQVLPNEFAALDERTDFHRLITELTLRGPARGTFVRRSFAEQARITWRVEQDAAGAVTGVVEAARAREAVQPSEHTAPALVATDIVLEHRGTIRLERAAGPERHFASVGEFDIDGQGRIGVVEYATNGVVSLVLVNPDGALVRRCDLGLPRNEPWMAPKCAWVVGDRWVVVRATYNEEFPTEGYWLDVSDGSMKKIDDFACPKPGDGIAGDGRGGFAVASSWEADGVTAFDAQGKRRWFFNDWRLGSVQDIAFKPDGTLGVLVGTTDLIIEVAPDGTKKREIDLEKAIKYAPNYVAGLRADAAGGWILHDFRGQPPIRHISAGEQDTGGFEPRYADGRTFRIYGAVRRAPDGRLWTSDGTAMLRLGEKGIVDLIIGDAPDSDQMNRLRAAAVGKDGRIYAVDGRNAFVHVFDSQGKRTAVWKPEPGDFAVEAGLGSITVDGDGSVYYYPTDGKGHMKFTADGVRRGFQTRRCDEVSEEWVARPNGREILVLGYENAFLFDAEGREIATVSRRADRKWLVNPDEAAFGDDGTFAILASPFIRGEVPPSVTFFAPDGTPTRTVDLPGNFHYARLAYDGRRAALCSGGVLLLVDRSTGNARRFALPGASENSWHTPYCSPRRDEAWVLSADTMSFERFALPAD